MSTFVEISKEAFEAIVGDTKPSISSESACGSSSIYETKDVALRSVTNYYETRDITQYYIQDINA